MPEILCVRWMTSVLPVCVFLLLASMAAPAAAQEPDTDGDTLPDAWETFFGLNPASPADAAGDPDGDGLTNVQEFIAGRHPVGRFARYFAEGSIGYFDTSLAVLNLSTTDTAHVSIALLDEAGGVTTHQVALAPQARQSVSLASIAARAGAVSAIVESDVAVAADRAMTWGTSGLGLSLDSGAPAPSTTWYFAEGATGPFLLFYLFENPGATPATVTTRYLREGATPISRTRTLPPHSRTTVSVNADDPGLAATSLGAVITSDVPILAERAMYLQANGTFAGGSASSAAPALSTQWYFGEGATGPFFHAFLALLNPGTAPATATVTYHMSDGSTASKAYLIPAEGRKTVYFNGEAGSPGLEPLAFGPVWFTVSSTQPILGERAMWWSEWPWYEGHAAIGSTSGAVAWGVAEGRHGGPANDATFVLIGNTTATAGQVRITLIRDAGAPETRDLPIAPGARLTVNPATLFGLTNDVVRFSVIVESIGGTPVPLAVDYARYRSVGGVPFSGGGAAPAVPVTVADTAPAVVATTPMDGATDVSSTANLTVTLNESVAVTPAAFSLACGGSPVGLSVPTASPASQYVIDPGTPLPASTSCTLTVNANAVTDVDGSDPPDVMSGNTVITFTTAAESAPVVSTTSPAAGAVQVGLAAPLTIAFSEPVDVTGNWFQIVCGTSGTRGVADTVVGGGPTTFTIDPNADFAAGELCTVTVVAAQVTDQDPIDPPDAMAANHVFAFTVDVGPSVAATTPANGAVAASTASVTVTFSEPVNVTGNWFQIVCNGTGTRNVADTVVTGGPTTFSIDPNVDFGGNDTCVVTLFSAQIGDQDGTDPPDLLPADYVFTFTSDAAPVVVSTTPANGATTTATSDLTVTFTEPVDVTGNWFRIVCTTSGTRNVADTVVTGGPTTFTIDPNVDFTPGESCTATVFAANVTDQDTLDPLDTMPADDSGTFTIDAAPGVVATFPADGATLVPVSSSFEIAFTEPVDVTGAWFTIICTVSGAHTANAFGGPVVFTIDPDTDFTAGETCTVTIVAAQVSDRDALDAPDVMAADFVFSVQVEP